MPSSTMASSSRMARSWRVIGQEGAEQDHGCPAGHLHPAGLCRGGARQSRNRSRTASWISARRRTWSRRSRGRCTCRPSRRSSASRTSRRGRRWRRRASTASSRASTSSLWGRSSSCRISPATSSTRCSRSSSARRQGAAASARSPSAAGLQLLRQARHRRLGHQGHRAPRHPQ